MCGPGRIDESGSRGERNSVDAPQWCRPSTAARPSTYPESALATGSNSKGDCSSPGQGAGQRFAIVVENDRSRVLAGQHDDDHSASVVETSPPLPTLQCTASCIVRVVTCVLVRTLPCSAQKHSTRTDHPSSLPSCPSHYVLTHSHSHANQKLRLQPLRVLQQHPPSIPVPTKPTQPTKPSQPSQHPPKITRTAAAPLLATYRLPSPPLPPSS